MTDRERRVRLIVSKTTVDQTVRTFAERMALQILTIEAVAAQLTNGDAMAATIAVAPVFAEIFPSQVR